MSREAGGGFGIRPFRLLTRINVQLRLCAAQSSPGGAPRGRAGPCVRRNFRSSLHNTPATFLQVLSALGKVAKKDIRVQEPESKVSSAASPWPSNRMQSS